MTIGSVAAEFGFWDFGRFAGKYRSLFHIDVPDDDHGHMVLFDTEYGPNLTRGAGTGADRAVSAPHSGLAQFVFLDGSVHTIADSIDLDNYRALSSIRGGEVIVEY